MPLRFLPDFLKTGDPALTHPWGKSYSPNHPKGKPNTPYPTDPQLEREWIVREWLEIRLGKLKDTIID